MLNILKTIKNSYRKSQQHQKNMQIGIKRNYNKEIKRTKKHMERCLTSLERNGP